MQCFQNYRRVTQVEALRRPDAIAAKKTGECNATVHQYNPHVQESAHCAQI